MRRWYGHNKDSDCQVDDISQCCVQCGADHSSPCRVCRGRAFHTDTCEASPCCGAFVTFSGDGDLYCKQCLEDVDESILSGIFIFETKEGRIFP